MSRNSTNRPGRSPWVANLTVALVSLMVGLGGGEIVCRLAPPAPPPLRFAGLAGRMDEDPIQREVVLAAMRSDPDLFWGLKPGTTLSANPWLPGLVANAQGLRETSVIPRSKPASEVRILFLGDSCTFGWGVRAEDSLVSRVEAEMRSRLPGRAIKCINAGVPAYTAFQGWRYLVTRGLAFEPDLVVATFGNNESISWDGRSDLEHYAAAMKRLPPPVLRGSALALRAWTAIAPKPTPVPSDQRRPRLAPDEFREVLGRIHAAASGAGAGTLFVTWPVRENLEPHRTASDRHPLQQVILDYTSPDSGLPAASAVDLVPLARSLAARRPLSALYLDAIHGTALANRTFGRDLAEELVRWVETGRLPG